MIDLINSDAQEIVNQFSYLTNNLLFKPNKTAEEYRDSALMEELDICWIKTLSSPEYRTDLRNEASAQTAKKLVGIPFVSRKMGLVSPDTRMAEVASRMRQEHRTLQQTFSKLVFCHFMSTCNGEEQKTLRDVMGGEFYRLPLI